jgi:hypothetical protein
VGKAAAGEREEDSENKATSAKKIRIYFTAMLQAPKVQE